MGPRLGMTCDQDVSFSKMNKALGCDDRQRDLFPLPVPQAVDVSLPRTGISRSVKRRLARASSAPWLLRQAVEALNGLYGGAGEAGGVEQQPTLAQQCALQRLSDDVTALGPCPGDLRPLEALRELQALPCYDGGDSGSMEPLEVFRLPAA